MKTIDRNGRIVLPRDMRRALGVDVGDDVSIKLVDKSIIISNPKQKDKKEDLMNGLKKLGYDHDLDVSNLIELVESL